MKRWKATNIIKAKYLGTLELENTNCFEIMETETRLVFGGFCNVGFLESGYIEKEQNETTFETLQELHEDLNTYFTDGKKYVNRIICNERM